MGIKPTWKRHQTTLSVCFLLMVVVQVALALHGGHVEHWFSAAAFAALLGCVVAPWIGGRWSRPLAIAFGILSFGCVLWILIVAPPK